MALQERGHTLYNGSDRAERLVLHAWHAFMPRKASAAFVCLAHQRVPRPMTLWLYYKREELKIAGGNNCAWH